MDRILKFEKFEQKEAEMDKSVLNCVIPPRERILSFSAMDFETFICEWASFKGMYNDIHRIGQAGDKGRDVIAYLKNGKIHYYQCKRYKEKLTPSEFWIEFGKLVYYTFEGEIGIPEKYYIIAANNLSTKLLDLIHNPKRINIGLIENWKMCCKNKIKKGSTIELTDDFKKYIQTFDFSIVDTVDIDSIIRDYSKTPLFYFRFGGINVPKRNEVMATPKNINEFKEKIYLTQLLEIYSEWKSTQFTFNNINSDFDVYEDFMENRSYYYNAESLRRDLRDTYLGDNEFSLIKNEMFSGLRNFMKGNFASSYDKLNATLHESTKVDLTACTSHSLLNFIHNDDKKGICHHLVNEKRMRWK